MSVWVCAACTTAYTVGAPRCPHCRSTERKDTNMPKSTLHGGASNEAGEVDVNIGAPTIGEPRVGESTTDEPVVEVVEDSAKVPAKKATPDKASTK